MQLGSQQTEHFVENYIKFLVDNFNGALVFEQGLAHLRIICMTLLVLQCIAHTCKHAQRPGNTCHFFWLIGLCNSLLAKALSSMPLRTY